MKENFSAAKTEVDEEIKLASEQKIPQIHEHQCSHQLTEIEGYRVFRSQQTLTLAETKELRIQKIIKEEGMSKPSIAAGQM